MYLLHDCVHSIELSQLFSFLSPPCVLHCTHLSPIVKSVIRKFVAIVRNTADSSRHLILEFVVREQINDNGFITRASTKRQQSVFNRSKDDDHSLSFRCIHYKEHGPYLARCQNNLSLW